jgi:hypothetical protein
MNAIDRVAYSWPYVLVMEWESKEPGHATAIRNFREAVEKCKRMR